MAKKCTLSFFHCKFITLVFFDHVALLHSSQKTVLPCLGLPDGVNSTKMIAVDTITVSSLRPLPGSPEDSMSFFRCRPRSINSLLSRGDLSLEFYTNFWHIVMRLLFESTFSFVGPIRERLPLNLLPSFLQPLFSVLDCVAMYTTLLFGYIFSSNL